MERVKLENGGWFDIHKAEFFGEASWFNGNNHISKATGSQWNHECLYLTASGNWVLNEWSQWQGTRQTYTQIDLSDAVEWLVANEASDDDIAKLPDEAKRAIADKLIATEV